MQNYSKLFGAFFVRNIEKKKITEEKSIWEIDTRD